MDVLGHVRTLWLINKNLKKHRGTQDNLYLTPFMMTACHMANECLLGTHDKDEEDDGMMIHN